MNEKVTTSEQARYVELAARMEARDFGPIDGIDTTVPTPPSPDEAVGAAEVRVRLGRPSPSGTNGTGRSPKRQVRLPEDLDAALQARIDAEHGRRLAYCAPFLLTVRGEGAQ